MSGRIKNWMKIVMVKVKLGKENENEDEGSVMHGGDVVWGGKLGRKMWKTRRNIVNYFWGYFGTLDGASTYLIANELHAGANEMLERWEKRSKCGPRHKWPLHQCKGYKREAGEDNLGIFGETKIEIREY